MKQPLRYVAAGAANTVFGIANTFFVTWLLIHLNPTHAAAMTSLATLLATPINISVSFFTYKYFVFRTKGNTAQEYLRSFLVYLPSLLISSIAVGPLSVLLQRIVSRNQAPFLAQAIVIGSTFVLSFLGHKHITFRRSEA